MFRYSLRISNTFTGDSNDPSHEWFYNNRTWFIMLIALLCWNLWIKMVNFPRIHKICSFFCVWRNRCSCCNRNILDKNILYMYTSVENWISIYTSVFAIGIPWDDDVSDVPVYSILWCSICRKRRYSCSKILLFIHSMPTKWFYSCSFLSSLNIANTNIHAVYCAWPLNTWTQQNTYIYLLLWRLYAYQ